MLRGCIDRMSSKVTLLKAEVLVVSVGIMVDLCNKTYKVHVVGILVQQLWVVILAQLYLLLLSRAIGFILCVKRLLFCPRAIPIMF